MGEDVLGPGEGSSMDKMLEWQSYLNPREAKALRDKNPF